MDIVFNKELSHTLESFHGEPPVQETLVIVHASEKISTVTKELQEKIAHRVFLYEKEQKPVIYLSYGEKNLPLYLAQSQSILISLYDDNNKFFANINQEQAKKVKEILLEKNIVSLEVIGGYIHACLQDICGNILGATSPEEKFFLHEKITHALKSSQNAYLSLENKSPFRLLVNKNLVFEASYNTGLLK
jgi:hypothetical protein